ncbi:MAG: 1-deoxy-D-xylulose-5-phosphate reductoisomerase, partial [bacterium]|nr:1-deoxy-D-xylulose-5-phosphate reductoisomerase [bacterium]
SIIRGSREEKRKDDVNEFLTQELDYDIVVNGLVGSVGFLPTLKAIERGKIIALANKETIVAYGEIIKEALKNNKNASIRPVDSEHSALWQLLKSINRSELKKCYITASGGVVFKKKTTELSLKEVLDHPVWSMGKKVTVDSSTMVNKGLEVIEAHYLFDLAPQEIGVMIHPQSIIHASVLMKDGTYFSNMALPDMALPISHALFYPDRPKDLITGALEENEKYELSLNPVDVDRYLSLKLAYQALEKRATFPAVYNGANEGAVSLFLKEKIKFKEIVMLIERVMNEHVPEEKITIESISKSEEWAKKKAVEIGENL